MSNLSNLSVVEQGRANFAFSCADNTKTKDFKKEYKQYSKKLPMMIKVNGLAATFAFMFSKDNNKKEGKAYHALGNDLTRMFKQSQSVSFLVNDVSDFSELVPKILKVNSADYKLLTSEALTFLGWLRRFTEGLIDG